MITQAKKFHGASFSLPRSLAGTKACLFITGLGPHVKTKETRVESVTMTNMSRAVAPGPQALLNVVG
jgi:hypothetical protein